MCSIDSMASLTNNYYLLSCRVGDGGVMVCNGGGSWWNSMWYPCHMMERTQASVVMLFHAGKCLQRAFTCMNVKNDV